MLILWIMDFKENTLINKVTDVEINNYFNYLESFYTCIVNDVLSKHLCKDIIKHILSFIKIKNKYQINIYLKSFSGNLTE